MKLLSDKDLKYFTIGVSNLEEYLLSDELFWNLPGLSMLTLGGLFLAKARLESATLSSGDLVKFSEALKQIELISLKWRVALENKVQREITSRLNLWQNYLADYWNSPDEFGESYGREVRWRVMLQLLMDAVSGNFKEKNILKALDDRVKFSFQPGEFIWPEELSDKFNKQSYWFLYGNLSTGQVTK
jgi:hypothetical protein